MNAPKIHHIMACILLASAGAVDCAGSASTCAANPIHVTFVIHFDPLPTIQGQVLKSAYEAERDNLAWLADYLDALEKEKTAAFVPRLTLEMAGDHAEWYLEDDVGLELLRRLYRKGIHCFGTHFHRNLRQAPHVWRDAESPDSSALVTSEHIAMVDRLVAKIIGSDDPKQIRAANRTITGHFLDPDTAANAGFDTMTGGRNEAMNLFFDHDVYNPWRPADGWPLGEDLDSRWILVPQAPVLGQIGEHAPIPAGVPDGYTRGMRGMIWQDISVPAMRRKFLHLYLERRNPSAEKVWVFGWHEHTSDIFPEHGRPGPRRFRAAITDFVKWLNANFIGAGDPDGRPAVRYSNTDEVREAYLSWEKAHPRSSSFAYDARECDWNKYPYALKGLAWALICSHHEMEIENFKTLGVRAHKLLKAPDRDWRLRDSAVESAAPLKETYLLWSENGDTPVDFTPFIAGRAERMTATGARAQVDAAKLIVGREPIIVQAISGAPPAVGDGRRTPVQFRINVNYLASDEEAKVNCALLRRHLDLFRRAAARASYWLTALAAEQIRRVDPNLLRELIDSGMPLAHHGANRPPNPQPIHRVRGEDWRQDVAAILDYESFALDPVTGELDSGRTGGLKMLQEISGGRIKATGRFFQASILYVEKSLGCDAMIGLKENTGASTEAGWFLGMRGLPDALMITPNDLRREAARPGQIYRTIEDFIGRPATNEIRSIAVLAHDHDFRTRRGNDHAENPATFWATYEELLRWAASHPKLAMTTFQEILDDIEDDRVKTVGRDMLLKATTTVISMTSSPPEYITAAGDHLSLADAFQAFAFALGHFSERGSLPEQVVTRDILGPTAYRQEEWPEGRPADGEARARAEAPIVAKPSQADITIKGEEVASVARALDLSKEIPWHIAVGDHDVNPAVFLHLMAQATHNIVTSGKPGVALIHSGLNVLPAAAQSNRLADALTKLQFWTFKPQRPKHRDSPDTAQSAPGQSKGRAPATFFAVHCEPSTANPPIWDALGRFIAMEDRHSAKLTLMFNPQWAEFILADSSRFGRVKIWQQKGHELAVHHHNVAHGAWNGYTNRPGLKNDPRFRDSVPAAMKLLQALAAPDTMLTMCMGPDALWDSTDNVEIDETDYPDGITYDVDGMDVGLTRPLRTQFRGRSLIHLKHHFFAPGNRAAHLDAIKSEFRSASADDVLGVVTHDVDFMRSPDLIEEWFRFCEENAAPIRTVRDILNGYPREKMKEVKYVAQQSGAPSRLGPRARGRYPGTESPQPDGRHDGADAFRDGTSSR